MVNKIRDLPEVSSIPNEDEIILPIFNSDKRGFVKKINIIQIVEYIKEKVIEDGEFSVEIYEVHGNAGFRFKSKEKT